MASNTRTGSTQRMRRGSLEEHNRLVRAIIIALCESRLCIVWENPTGAAYRDGQLIRYGLKGSADITGILITGRRLEIEVKTGNATQQVNQKNYEAMIKKFGGIYIVARSVEDALMCVQKALKDEQCKTH